MEAEVGGAHRGQQGGRRARLDAARAGLDARLSCGLQLGGTEQGSEGELMQSSMETMRTETAESGGRRA